MSMRKLDILYNFISPVTGKILLDTNYVLVGDANGAATPSQTIQLANLPNLTNNYIWVGNNASPNRPQESNVLTAAFIIKAPNTQLPNAEALNAAIYSVTPANVPPIALPGIAKVEVDGTISIAVPDVDYAKPATLLSEDYFPTEPQSLATKSYVDAMIDLLRQELTA